ncbi:hypothetical protein ACFL49_02160, partial [Candidatus Omnitrophota bacterium]
GIAIEQITSDGADITSQWKLTNFPSWYKGRDQFPAIDQFKSVLNPFLPFNQENATLYTSHRYTFIYQWQPDDLSQPLPDEDSLKITYINVGTKNTLKAEHLNAPRLIVSHLQMEGEDVVVQTPAFFPFSGNYLSGGQQDLELIFNNLESRRSSLSQFKIIDKNNGTFALALKNKEGETLDLIDGRFYINDHREPYFVYRKNLLNSQQRSFNASVLIKHCAAIAVMFYIVFICWLVGAKFVKRVRWHFEQKAERGIIPFFLGSIILTFFFLIMGLFQLIYYWLIFGILIALLFFLVDPECFNGGDVKQLIQSRWRQIIKKPWMAIFLILLVVMLFYNLTYCFLPATYLSGSGDVENSCIPVLNSYVINHSFKTPIYNSTYGMNPQCFDVMRTICFLLLDEPGIYLWSFAHIILLLLASYLICKYLFKVKYLLVYFSLFLFLCAECFTEALHFGKFYTISLAYLLMALYCCKFAYEKKKFLMPAICFGFLTAQFPHFVLPSVAYFALLFSGFAKEKGPLHKKSFVPIIKALGVYLVISSVFCVKTFIEVGVIVPPGPAPEFFRNLFARLNEGSRGYVYIDNDYIRHYFTKHGLRLLSEPSDMIVNAFKTAPQSLNYYFSCLVLVFFVLKSKANVIYVILLSAIFVMITFCFPHVVRLRIYYIIPALMLLFSIFDYLRVKFDQVIIKRWPKIAKFNWVIVFIIVGCFSTNIHLGKISIQKSKLTISSLNYGSIRRKLKEPYRFGYDLWVEEVLPVFVGKSKYEYLNEIGPDTTMFRVVSQAEKFFDHALLIRQHVKKEDVVLVMPVRHHSRTKRLTTPRHALGSVIYQKDIDLVMKDLKTLNIKYLSVIPITYRDYNPNYSPLFEPNLFYKYFKLLYIHKGCQLYEINYNGTNTEMIAPPYPTKGLPFQPMIDRNSN